ncbi:hypothetical protein BJX70DRAFT_307821 [Aspergillus crustosus]
MTTPSNSSSPSLPPCLFPSSLSSLFLSCIQARKDKKGRHNSNPSPKSITATNNRDSACEHTTPPASRCICTYPIAGTPTALPQLPGPHRSSLCITQTTSIRIVESDSSSEYDSSSSSSDTNSVSDYGCDCDCRSLHHDHGRGHGHENDQDEQEREHLCEDCDEDDIDLPKCSQPAIKRSLSHRPLPPLPSQSHTGSSSVSGSRKLPEIKTRFIEETIPEEDEDEYLAQCQREQDEEDAKRHKCTTSRRKSMIELFDLSSPFTTGPWSGSEPRPPSGSGLPGLSLSFSNLNFRFPLPPAWGGQSQVQAGDGHGGQSPEKKKKKRPMSMSVLPTVVSKSTHISTLVNEEEEKATLHKTLTCGPELPSTTTTISATDTATTTGTTTKKERRMGTVLFPPLTLLSRSSVASNRDSAGSSRSLFC